MAKDNNFKQMLFQELKEMPDAPSEVENGVDGSIGFIGHWSRIVELYLPKLIDAMAAFLGAKPK